MWKESYLFIKRDTEIDITLCAWVAATWKETCIHVKRVLSVYKKRHGNRYHIMCLGRGNMKRTWYHATWKETCAYMTRALSVHQKRQGILRARVAAIWKETCMHVKRVLSVHKKRHGRVLSVHKKRLACLNMIACYVQTGLFELFEHDNMISC